MVLYFLAGLQADPDLVTAEVGREIERFQAEYLRVYSLTPEEKELAPIRARLMAGIRKESEASGKFTEKFAYNLLANYKMQKDLHRRHGGRVVLSAFGFMVAKDAMIEEWRLWEQQGRWRFPSERLRNGVFESLEKMSGDGVVEGKRASEIFSRPLLDSR